MNHFAISAAVLILSTAAQAQHATYDKTIFGDLGMRGSTWTENTMQNFLYHNDGGGTRKFILNANSTLAGTNSYLTVNANTDGFFGMAVHSPYDTAIPYYGYVLNSNANGHICNHSYNPNNSSWTLAMEGDVVLRVDANRDLLMPLGGVVADFYDLNGPRSEFAMITRFDPAIGSGSGDVWRRVELPDGSEISQFQATIVDFSRTDNLTVRLVRYTHTATYGVEDVIAQVTSTGSGGGNTYSTTSISSGAAIVDNALFAYYIHFVQKPNTDFGSARTQVRVSEL